MQDGNWQHGFEIMKFAIVNRVRFHEESCMPAMMRQMVKDVSVSDRA